MKNDHLYVVVSRKTEKSAIIEIIVNNEYHILSSEIWLRVFSVCNTIALFSSSSITPILNIIET